MAKGYVIAHIKVHDKERFWEICGNGWAGNI